jgi:U5 small nuclear ribonucleoprotein component
MADNNDDQDLYDEFGNYIGPELDSSDDDDDDDSDASDDEKQAQAPDDASDVSGEEGAGAMVVASDQDASTADPMNAIVLHEDKEHYASAEQTFGEGVRTAVLDEDAMDLDTPIVEPVVTKSNKATANVIEDDDWTYTEEYLTKVLLSNPSTRTRRGVALVGHLHHGKTSLVDTLLEQTLRKSWGPRASLEVNAGGGPRYLDLLQAEQERQMSLVSTPLTALLADTRGKTYGITLVDCPGHTQFHDETVAALKAVDGAVLCVDAVEGIMMHTEMVVKQAILEGLPITLCITKVDRLMIELKLPPRDAYYKLLHVIDQCNALIAETSRGRYPKLDPRKGNVAFSSAQHGWLFTLPSFAQLYLDHHDDDGLGKNLTVEEFAKRLWGDSYLDPATKQFHTHARDCSVRVERTFCTHVLEPLYKLYSACLGEREVDLKKLLRSLGVLLTKEELRASARPLLRSALSKFFETATCGFVDMIVQHV